MPNENGKKQTILIILDGWGFNPAKEGNAIASAGTPNMDFYYSNYPFASLEASGIAVGLPWGEMGNSEVGHMNIGAGIVLYQNLPRITMSVQTGSFFTNPVFEAAIKHTQTNKSNLHFMGLLGTGGVHAHQEHLYALLELTKIQGVKNVYLHLFTDGRDTAPNIALSFVEELKQKMAKVGLGKIASISGRYYAMDRNKNWDRLLLAYRALTEGVGEKAYSAEEAIQNSYNKNVFDEMILPTVIMEKGSDKSVATINDNDAVIFFNFRPDRALQMTQAFALDDLPAADKAVLPQRKAPGNLFFACMTRYDKTLNLPVAFPPIEITKPLARVISENNLTQFHIAETEKYAHVTYFFNGGIETPFPGEVRKIIPSPSVANYNLKPEMSANEVADCLIEQINLAKFDFYVVNFANADMVGHTGDFEAAKNGIRAADTCVGRIVQAALGKNGSVLITSDHGNAEKMIDPNTGAVSKDHSTNPVPFIIITPSNKLAEQRDSSTVLQLQLSPIGVLADIAPTILEIMGVEKPEEMTGLSLLSSL